MSRRCSRHSLAWLVLLSLVFSAAGCQGLSLNLQPATVTPSPSLEQEATATQTQPVPTDSPGPPGTLRLWLPPQFDPAAGTPAGEVLRQRLESFSLLYPDLELEVRIKAENGPGGLLTGLSTASAAAPGALPDVVALPRSLLEAAALKGILYPLEELTSPLDAVDWYPYAIEMGYVQEKIFGLPFSADMLLVLAYAGTDVTEPEGATPQPTPTLERALQETATPAPLLGNGFSWSRLMSENRRLAFPAADPKAVFTLLLYRSVGGAVVDADGRPFLDENLLAQVLQVYQQAVQAGVLPPWLVQIDTNQQVWDAFENQQVDLATVRMSHYLAVFGPSLPDQAGSSQPARQFVGQLPSLDGQPYTLATGWVWAVASPQPERRTLAGKLVEFLAEASFMAEWNAALGYLPPRSDALTEWTVGSGDSSAALRQLAVDLSTAARLEPSEDVLAVLGPPVRQAVVGVLNQQVEPEVAARAAVAALNLP